MRDATEPPPLLEARAISKRYPGVQALDRVDLTARAGQVLAVVGENGAGKSTLMKILAGVERPDGGELRIEGEPTVLPSVRAAQEFGIALIHQELNLADNLDVAGNVFLGREPQYGGVLGLVQKSRLRQETKTWLERVGLDCQPSAPVAALSIAQRQLVEIAKALSTGARLLIMDEPTSSLTQGEAERLFEVVRELVSGGVAVIYISHRLGEVKELADRVLVLRDGRAVGELKRGDVSHDAMVRLMVGRDIAQFYPRQTHSRGQPLLEVHGLRVPGRPQHALSFVVHAGELVGIAGLVGAGRTELLRVLFGIDRPIAGIMGLAGEPYSPQGPADAIRHGVALVPEDRKLQGLILEMSVRNNVSLAALRQHQRLGWIARRREKRLARQLAEQLAIRTPSLNQSVGYLSGGNQQKVVLAKWLALKPRVLLLDEPTRGIDVGAKEEIYQLMERLAAQGVAVLFVSSEMEEILGMSDRALVMHEGMLAGELTRGELTEQAVMHLATGTDRRATARLASVVPPPAGAIENTPS
jgi:ribose transport system ATP-binding protein